jgi:D-glycero-beta-D-manno-heptose 1-phosphate adenylyltransferase
MNTTGGNVARVKALKSVKTAPSDVAIVFDDGSLDDDGRQLQVKPHAVRDVFGPGANPNKRYIATYEQAAEYAKHIKGLGLEIVYTLGTFDLMHIGHGRYLQRAKELGDILIIGVEVDDAIKRRKGPTRPVVPFKERVEMLCHLRHVDIVVPIPDYDERGFSGMKMIEAICPNTIVASERSFKEAEDTHQWIDRMKPFCDHVEILHSQAETSTSSKIRDLIIHVGSLVKEGIQDSELSMSATLDEFEQAMTDAMSEAVLEAKQSLTDSIQKAFAEVKERADEAVKKA